MVDVGAGGGGWSTSSSSSSSSMVMLCWRGTELGGTVGGNCSSSSLSLSSGGVHNDSFLVRLVISTCGPAAQGSPDIISLQEITITFLLRREPPFSHIGSHVSTWVTSD